MHSSYRQGFFTIFAVFYLIALPFLIILSLGYDLNIQERGLDNTLTLRLQTIPRSANIEIQGQTGQYKTPAELRVADNSYFDLKISSEKYLTEDFKVLSPRGVNSTTRIIDLRLLPIEKSLDTQHSGQLVSLLSNNFLLSKEQQGYAVLDYSFSGFTGALKIIENQVEQEILSFQWEKLEEDVFWQPEGDLILYRKRASNTWSFINLKAFENKFVSVVRNFETELLLLDDRGNLWTLNLQTNSLGFVTNNIQGLAYTESPESIWIWSGNSINQLPVTKINPEEFPALNLYSQNNQFVSNSLPEFNQFVVRKLFLGKAFKLRNKIVYIPDANLNQWRIISDQVSYFNTYDGSIYWLTETGEVWTYSLLLESGNKLGSIDLENTQETPETVKLVYNDRWKHLFLYSSNKVYAVWTDTALKNESVVGYRPQIWIDKSSCLPEIRDNYQFCVQENRLVHYNNNNIAI